MEEVTMTGRANWSKTRVLTEVVPASKLTTRGELINRYFTLRMGRSSMRRMMTMVSSRKKARASRNSLTMKW